jgi:hypothetical protein
VKSSTRSVQRLGSFRHVLNIQLSVIYFVTLIFLQLAKQKIHLNKQYHDNETSFREKMGSLVKRVCTESLPSIGRISLVRNMCLRLKSSASLLTMFRQCWFPLFIVYNFMWPVFFVWRLVFQFVREIFGRGKKHYYGIERHAYSYVCKHSVQLHIHVSAPLAAHCPNHSTRNWISSCTSCSNPGI